MKKLSAITTDLGKKIADSVSRGTTAWNTVSCIYISPDEKFALVLWPGKMSWDGRWSPRAWYPTCIRLVLIPSDLGTMGGMEIWESSRKSDGLFTEKTLQLWVESFNNLGGARKYKKHDQKREFLEKVKSLTKSKLNNRNK